MGAHVAALGPGQAAHDVEAEPDAAEPAAVTAVDLDEPFEDALPVARARCRRPRRRPPRPPGRPRARPPPDQAALGRVLEGVLQELAEHDVGGERVAPSPAAGRRGMSTSTRCLSDSTGSPSVAACDPLGQVERLVPDRLLLRARPGPQQQVVHELPERHATARRWCARPSAARRRSACPSGRRACWRSPRTIVIGVRSSWLVVARNRSLASSSSLAAVTSRKSTTSSPVSSISRADHVEPAPGVGSWKVSFSPGAGSGNGGGSPDRLLGGDGGELGRGRVPPEHPALAVEHRDAVRAGVEHRPLVRPLPHRLLVGDGVADRDAGVPGEQLQQLQLQVARLALGEQRVERAVRDGRRPRRDPARSCAARAARPTPGRRASVATPAARSCRCAAACRPGWSAGRRCVLQRGGQPVGADQPQPLALDEHEPARVRAGQLGEAGRDAVEHGGQLQLGVDVADHVGEPAHQPGPARHPVLGGVVGLGPGGTRRRSRPPRRPVRSALMSTRTSSSAAVAAHPLGAQRTCPPVRTRSSTAWCSAVSSSGTIGARRPSISSAGQPKSRSAAAFQTQHLWSRSKATTALGELASTARAISSSLPALTSPTSP